MIVRGRVEQLTEEQRKKLNRLGFKFMLKSFWNGIHNALMAIVMNIILTMLGTVLVQQNLMDPDGAGPYQFIGSVAIGIFIIRRLLRINREQHQELKKSVEEILTK